MSQKKTVLVVDDFETTLFTVGMTLQKLGYEVLKANNGEEAIKLMDGRPLSLIITDYNMPGITGLDLTKKVRANERYSSIPILVLSTDTSPQKKEDILKAGATWWINKPYQLGEFQKIINKIIA